VAILRPAKDSEDEDWETEEEEYEDCSSERKMLMTEAPRTESVS
jgi:hypothetical protein